MQAEPERRPPALRPGPGRAERAFLEPDAEQRLDRDALDLADGGQGAEDQGRCGHDDRGDDAGQDVRQVEVVRRETRPLSTRMNASTRAAPSNR